MNINFIEDYVKRLQKQDIYRFAIRQGIRLDNNELTIIYDYIKTNYQKIIYDKPQVVLDDLKKKLKPETYEKATWLYNKYRDKITLFQTKIRENN